LFELCPPIHLKISMSRPRGCRHQQYLAHPAPGFRFRMGARYSNHATPTPELMPEGQIFRAKNVTKYLTKLNTKFKMQRAHLCAAILEPW
jgi:hypothetical protein